MNSDVQAYFAKLPPAVRTRLSAMRDVILSVAPAAEESISYGVPTFKLEGKPFIYCAAFKNHTSLYPMTAAIRRTFADELQGYKTSTGTIQFALDAPLRVTLVKRLVKARLAEVRAASASRPTAKQEKKRRDPEAAPVESRQRRRVRKTK